MAATTPGTPARPRQYIRKPDAFWWTKNPRYRLFIFRELSSGVVAIYAWFLVCLLYAAKDPLKFKTVLNALTSPGSYLLHAIVLTFALLNTFTTFNVAPRVLKLHRGEEPVPESLISGAHYAAAAVATIIVIAIALGVK